MDNNNLYVFGVKNNNYRAQLRVEKRLKSNGNLLLSNNLPNIGRELEILPALTNIRSDNNYLYLGGLYETIRNEYSENVVIEAIQKLNKLDLSFVNVLARGGERDSFIKIGVDRDSIYSIFQDATTSIRCSEGGYCYLHTVQRRNKSTGRIFWSYDRRDLSYNSIYNYYDVENDGSYVYLGGNYYKGFDDSYLLIEKIDKERGKKIWDKFISYVNEGESIRRGYLEYINEIVLDERFIYAIAVEPIHYTGSYYQDYSSYMLKIDKLNSNVIWKVSLLTKAINEASADENYIYIVGEKPISNEQNEVDRMWSIEVREKSNGNLVCYLNYNPTPYWDSANSIKLDENFVYISGIKGNYPNSDFLPLLQKREKRFLIR
ncbi:MAG: hypothetical protein NZ866_00435 [Patescibacteria group bacterium]|nr:hypothetical protein [Patescibacteria group bacterium]